MKGIDITASQRDIISALYFNANMRQTDIANRVNVHPATVSAQVRLEKLIRDGSVDEAKAYVKKSKCGENVLDWALNYYGFGHGHRTSELAPVPEQMVRDLVSQFPIGTRVLLSDPEACKWEYVSDSLNVVVRITVKTEFNFKSIATDEKRKAISNRYKALYKRPCCVLVRLIQDDAEKKKEPEQSAIIPVEESDQLARLMVAIGKLDEKLDMLEKEVELLRKEQNANADSMYKLVSQFNNNVIMELRKRR